MVQLFIEGKPVDIDEEFEIRLEKDFDDSDVHVVEESHYSFEVELPITIKNREAFGFVDVFDVSNKFGKVYNAVLNVDDVNILDGKFIMEEISDKYYSGNLYVPARAKLKDVLGDKKMKDIKSHDMYIASWDDIKQINEGIIFNRADADRHIAFPYILYRLPYNDTGSTYDITTQDLSVSGNTFSTENLFPAYNVLSVLTDCFEGEGYKLQGNIFGQDKFTELYQTFSTSWKDYHNSKNTPYYLKFRADYNLRKNDNTSSTALIDTIFDDPQMAVGTDAILLSENTKITNEIDDYNMLVKAKNSDARSLIIPKTGWYRIACSGNMSFPMNSGEWRQEGRATVDGNYNDSDRVDLSQNIFEFQIKKTDQPMSHISYYSFNCATPMVPTNLSKENTAHSGGLFGIIGGWEGINLSYDEARNKFAKNGKTALVKDYSGFEIDDFIAGARLGCPYVSESYSDDNLEDRRSTELIFTCLPNPAKATKATETDDGGVEHQFMLMYSLWGLKNDNDAYRMDYGKNTAQVLVRADSYSNFEGYNKFTPNLEASGGTWDTTTDYEKISYPGQSNSSARATSKTAGSWTINTCVWLEEGDMISFELLMPYNNYADECGWLEFCDWKHFYKSGINWTRCSFDFEMGYVSSDEKWVPTANKPMPSFDEIRNPKPTNVNQWLGDTKVNDYIENFLNTFNLRLSRVNSKTYSIDTMSNEQQTEGNIIDIDDWAYVTDATFKRINTKSTKFEWTISTDEEGYVHGNNTRQAKTARDESGYTGGIEFVDESNTSENEVKIKSNWSYTWMKDIEFVNGDASYSGGTKEVPVIGDAKLWENTYLSIADQEYATDKTSRLIYLDKDKVSGMYNSFNIQRYINDTTIPEVKAPVMFCKNYIEYVSSLGQENIFRLDYNNKLSTKTDRSITDIFYKIKKGYQYSVEVPVRLPNDIYHKIRSNTMVKFNDALFRVIGIEGHDVNGKNEATLKLISL